MGRRIATPRLRYAPPSLESPPWVFAVELLALGYLPLLLACALATGLAAVIAHLMGAPYSALVVTPLLPLLFAAGWLAVNRRLPGTRDPGGLPLAPGDAPRMFLLLKEVTTKVGAPPIHAVRITAERELRVERVYRPGFRVPVKNHLVVGMPILLSVSPQEFRCLVAATVVRAGDPASKAGDQARRAAAYWTRLIRSRLSASWLEVLLEPCIAQWASGLNSNLALAGAGAQLRADRAATAIAGRQCLAAGLLNALRLKPLLDRTDGLGPGPRGGAARSAADPHTGHERLPLSELEARLEDRGATEAIWARLQRAFAAADAVPPGHPVARLKALAVRPEAPPQPPTSAARHLLGPVTDQLFGRLDTLPRRP